MKTITWWITFLMGITFLIFIIFTILGCGDNPKDDIFCKVSIQRQKNQILEYTAKMSYCDRFIHLYFNDVRFQDERGNQVILPTKFGDVVTITYPMEKKS